MQIKRLLLPLCVLLTGLSACQPDGPTTAFSVEEALEHPRTTEQVTLFEYPSSSLPAEFFALPHLKYLEILFSRLDSLPPGLAQASNLKHLLLDGNLFQKIPESVTQLPSLEFLSLGSNPLREDGLKGIGRLKTLRLLLLKSCGITKLPDEMAELPNLTELDLALNPMAELPPVIARIPSLEHVWLGGGEWLHDSASIEVLRKAPKLAKVTLSLSGIPDSTRDSLRNLLPHLRIL